jgi:HEPN domain-containing protein
MTNSKLAESYLEKAKVRLRALEVLVDGKAYSDVFREAQEIVELALKAMLREIGVEPPKYHDVGSFLIEHENRFTSGVRTQLETIARESSWLRSQRELSFCGDVDFIPTGQYGLEETERAYHDATFVVEVAVEAISGEKE